MSEKFLDEELIKRPYILYYNKPDRHATYTVLYTFIHVHIHAYAFMSTTRTCMHATLTHPILFPLLDRHTQSQAEEDRQRAICMLLTMRWPAAWVVGERTGRDGTGAVGTHARTCTPKINVPCRRTS
jgi:hypothetical protein